MYNNAEVQKVSADDAASLPSDRQAALQAVNDMSVDDIDIAFASVRLRVQNKQRLLAPLREQAAKGAATLTEANLAIPDTDRYEARRKRMFVEQEKASMDVSNAKNERVVRKQSLTRSF